MLRRSRPAPLLRRFAAAGAALLLALGAFSLAALPAQAAPQVPTITFPAVSLDTVSATTTISGTLPLESGYDYVRVQWRSQSTIVEECFAMLAPGDTTFSCDTTTPAPGIYSVVAQHSDAAEPLDDD